MLPPRNFLQIFLIQFGFAFWQCHYNNDAAEDDNSNDDDDNVMEIVCHDTQICIIEMFRFAEKVEKGFVAASTRIEILHFVTFNVKSNKNDISGKFVRNMHFRI